VLVSAARRRSAKRDVIAAMDTPQAPSVHQDKNETEARVHSSVRIQSARALVIRQTHFYDASGRPLESQHVVSFDFLEVVTESISNDWTIVYSMQADE
jgi:hypothetical protein